MRMLVKTAFVFAVAASMVGFAPKAGANVIFFDDFDVDGDPVPSPADIGTYEAGSTGVADGGSLLMQGSKDRVFGTATQISSAGTQLRYEWDWNLLPNDQNDTENWDPIAGLRFLPPDEDLSNDRALGMRIYYHNDPPTPATAADIHFEQYLNGVKSGGFGVDSGLDVPVGVGFLHWTIDYTVGDATATLNVDGVPALTNVIMPVRAPGRNVAGPWFLGNLNEIMRVDNVTLTVIPEPGTLGLLALAGLLVLRRRR